MTARSYMGTLNNPVLSIEEYFKKYESHTRYITGQLEKGENGTPHFQFYINLVTPQRISYLKKICPLAHFEKCRSDKHSMDYCNKVDSRIGQPLSIGTKPMHRNSEHDWNEIWESAKRGDFESIPAEIRIKHHRTIKQIAKDHMKMQETQDTTKGIWYYGKSGTGKSSTARKDYPDAFVKPPNKWFDGYEQQKTIILEELDPSHDYLGMHLKLWADHYGTILETKGGAIPSNHSTFLVTSQYLPEDIFHDPEMLEAINRRFVFKKFERRADYIVPVRRWIE